MKKAIAVLMTLSLACMLFAQGSSESGSAPKSGKKTVLKWSSVQASTSVISQGVDKIVDYINKNATGIEVQYYSGGQLGGSRDQVEGVSTGMIDVVTEGPAQFGQLVPLMSMVEAPYIYRDFNHLDKALKGHFGQVLEAEMEKKDMHILGDFYYGTRQLSTTSTPVNSIADLKGLKIRVPEVNTYMDMVKSWGANPTPLSFNELYLGLQQNVVAGQENPLTTFDSAKFYEVQKYLVLTNHIICSNVFIINKGVWDGISDADKKVVNDAVKIGCDYITETTYKQEGELLDAFKAKGVTVMSPDVAPFREATLKIISDNYGDKWGRDLIDEVVNLK
jgi:tripartite ATP-independent transporter DctP family solute receptor